MVSSHLIISTDDDGRTGVTVRYASDASNTSYPLSSYAGVIVAGNYYEPESKAQKRRDSTHVPFYKGLPKFKRRQK